MSNYEKGEQIKSVEEFVKEVLAKDKPYYLYDTYRDTSKSTYYQTQHDDAEWGKLFHAIPKKEKVKFWKFVDETGRDTKSRYNKELSMRYDGKDDEGKPIIEKRVSYLFFDKWEKTNCFIEVEV